MADEIYAVLIADVNHDGKMDVVSGPFWYEGPAFTKRHEYRPAKASFEAPKPGGGNMKEILRRVPLWTTRLDERHTKNAMLLKSVLEHLPITRLKNVQRQQE